MYLYVDHQIELSILFFFFQNADKPISISAGSLLYSLIPVTRQHLSLDQITSIKHLIHRILTWNVRCDSKTNFQVKSFLFNEDLDKYFLF